MRLLGDGGLGLTATRDYANKLVSGHVASMSNSSRMFRNNIIYCSGHFGRGILNISPRALGGCNTMDHRATHRVMGNILSLAGTSVTITIANVTKPSSSSAGGPINLICVTISSNGDAVIGGLLGGFANSIERRGHGVDTSATLRVVVRTVQ